MILNFLKIKNNHLLNSSLLRKNWLCLVNLYIGKKSICRPCFVISNLQTSQFVGPSFNLSAAKAFGYDEYQTSHERIQRRKGAKWLHLNKLYLWVNLANGFKKILRRAAAYMLFLENNSFSSLCTCARLWLFIHARQRSSNLFCHAQYYVKRNKM